MATTVTTRGFGELIGLLERAKSNPEVMRSFSGEVDAYLAALPAEANRTPDEAWARFGLHNQFERLDLSPVRTDRSERGRLVNDGQDPYGVVVSCMDARIPKFISVLGHFYSKLVAGAQLNREVLAALAYAAGGRVVVAQSWRHKVKTALSRLNIAFAPQSDAEHFESPGHRAHLIAVVGHSHCGALGAVQNAITTGKFPEGDLGLLIWNIYAHIRPALIAAHLEQIKNMPPSHQAMSRLVHKVKVRVMSWALEHQWLSHALHDNFYGRRRVLRSLRAGFQSLPEIEQARLLQSITDGSVIASMETITSDPVFAPRLATGTLSVVGAVFDLETSDLRPVCAQGLDLEQMKQVQADAALIARAYRDSKTFAFIWQQVSLQAFPKQSQGLASVPPASGIAAQVARALTSAQQGGVGPCFCSLGLFWGAQTSRVVALRM